MLKEKGSWGEGSAGNVPVVQTGGPGHVSPLFTENLGVGVPPGNPSDKRWRLTNP